MRLGLFVIAFRLALQILFGTRIPGNTLFTVPGVELPDWLSGFTIGGPVTTEAKAAPDHTFRMQVEYEF